MDPRSFDALARSLAAPKSRRGLLGGLAALAAGMLGARAADAQVTQAQCGNKICAANPGVCTDGCVCCVYSNGNSRCRPPGTCSPGTVATTTTTAAPTCHPSGTPGCTIANFVEFCCPFGGDLRGCRFPGGDLNNGICL